MKKISTFSLIATLFSTCTFAAPESKDTSKEQKNESTIYLSVFDRTQEPSPDLNKKETFNHAFDCVEKMLQNWKNLLKK